MASTSRQKPQSTRSLELKASRNSSGRGADVWKAVESLRGFVIICVLLNHFVNRYLSDDWAGIANLYLSILFFLSGFGAYKSLEKRSNGGNLTRRIAQGYHRDRFLRIYPLYWLGLLVDSVIRGKSYPVVTWLGLLSPEHYWFVNVILWCYFLTPVVFMLLERLGPRLVLVASLVLLAATNAGVYVWYLRGSVFATSLMSIDVLGYRGTFLLHFTLFVVGMTMPGLIKEHTRAPSRVRYYLVGSGMLLVAVLTRGPKTAFPLHWLLLGWCFVLLAFFFTMTSIKLGAHTRVLSWVGRYSYPIYLLHWAYYGFLENVGLLRYGSAKSVFLTVLLFPLFLVACQGTQELANYLARYLATRRADSVLDRSGLPDG